MLSFLSKIKTTFKNTFLNVCNLVINSCILLYLISIFGFKHIDINFIKSTLIGVGLSFTMITFIVLFFSVIVISTCKLAIKNIESYITESIKNIHK